MEAQLLFPMGLLISLSLSLSYLLSLYFTFSDTFKINISSIYSLYLGGRYAIAEVPGGIARDGMPLPGIEVKIQYVLEAQEG